MLCDDPSPELLVRSVTHELRQPLSLIVGYAELLARAPDELTRAELLAEIRRAARGTPPWTRGPPAPRPSPSCTTRAGRTPPGWCSSAMASFALRNPFPGRVRRGAARLPAR